MKRRVVTWNVNSVRLRLDQLDRLAKAHRPDVICLQEIKVHTDQFPALDVAAMGYPHQAVNGIKGYNGVAILSRRPLSDIRIECFAGRDDGRHIAATVDGLTIHNLYLPAGGDIPDPARNDKFAHKLQVYAELVDWTGRSFSKADRAVVVGDFNVAPLETDVWSHQKLKSVVTHTPVERERMAVWMDKGGWIDVGRHFVPPEERLYTWWSYRGGDWKTANRGRRLDHVWASPGLAPALDGFSVIEAARGWDRPSDHVPVIADFDLSRLG